MSYARIGNLIRENSPTNGTGNKTLAAVDGFQRVSTAFGTGDNGEFNPVLFFSNQDAAEWEVVQGYMSDSNTFVPVTVLDSSNSGSAVNFSAGTKFITCALPSAALYRPDHDLFDGLSLCRLAKLEGVAQFFGDRFADSFGATTYIDSGSSTNEDTGTTGLVKPTVTQTKIDTTGLTRIGNMTYAGGLDAAFNGTTSESFPSGACSDQSGSGNATVGIDWGSGVTKNVTQFKIYFGMSGGSGPFNNATNGTVYLEGSNDNFSSDVNTLYTSGTIAGNYGATLTVSSGITAGNYRYHRTRITNGSGASAYLSEVEFYEPIADDMTLLSVGVTPGNDPDRIILVARVKHVDSATAGTDYNFTVSRNGGSNFSSNLMLHDRFTDPIDSCHVIESDPIDVSGQTSPSTVVLKMVTANNKNVELRDWYFRAVP